MKTPDEMMAQFIKSLRRREAQLQQDLDSARAGLALVREMIDKEEAALKASKEHDAT